MAAYNGSFRSEKIYGANWNYDWTTFYMRGGNDYVETQDDVEYYFNGGIGNDYFYGNSENDFIVGGDGNDKLYGLGGDDRIDGGNNNDTISGGGGEDYLDGGRGRDILLGGVGADVFFYGKGDSDLKSSSVDCITDWNGREDYIVISGSVFGGSASNYAERATRATTIEAARDQAEGSSTLMNKAYVFLYNHANDRGFLLMDLNGNGEFDTGVVIKGAGSAADMSYDHIL